MITLPRRSPTPTPSRYEQLGLRDLPFSPDPVLNPYSTDPRNNGAIYAQLPVQDAIAKFERLLIRPDDFQNRARIASLWAAGDVQQGRGMGKTALLRFFQQRINSDWGATQFNGQFSAVVIYAAFPAVVSQRWMEQLAWAALVDTCRNGVLDAALAALRLEQLSDKEANDVIYAKGDENPANLLDDTVLEANQISVADLTAQVEGALLRERVERAPANALASGDFENYLRSLRKDRNLEPYYVPRETNGLVRSRTLFFNDVVRYLRAAGYAGGYLFVDDIENLTDQMARRHRLGFAKDFGLCTVRPGYANTEHHFFSCVLSTHQSSAIPLAQAWSEAGLSAIARLDPGAPTSVELPMPTQDQARAIVIAHLDHYRTNQNERGTIAPFTVDGMRALVGRSQHPRNLLANAARTVLRAVDRGITSIDANIVTEAMDDTGTMPTTDFAEGIDEAL